MRLCLVCIDATCKIACIGSHYSHSLLLPGAVRAPVHRYRTGKRAWPTVVSNSLSPLGPTRYARACILAHKYTHISNPEISHSRARTHARILRRPFGLASGYTQNSAVANALTFCGESSRFLGSCHCGWRTTAGANPGMAKPSEQRTDTWLQLPGRCWCFWADWENMIAITLSSRRQTLMGR